MAETSARPLFTARTSSPDASLTIVSARRNVIEVMREPGRVKERFVAVPPSGVVEFDGRFEVKAPAGAEVGPVGVKPAVKLPRDVPALAFSALPMVKLASGELVLAVKSGRADVSAILCERFRV
jgi:hypothetical protein